jgi:hypothetical protein
MAAELTPDREIQSGAPESRLDSLSFEPPPEQRELISWPVTEEQRQEWNEALRQLDGRQPFTERFPGSAERDSLKGEPAGARAERRESPPGVSEGELKHLRDVLSRLGVVGDKRPGQPAEKPHDFSDLARGIRESRGIPGERSGAPSTVQIDYPGGKKSRTCKLDESGNLTEFTVRDQKGEKTYYKDDASKWFSRDEDGVEVQVKGEFKLDGKDLLYIKPGGYVRTEKADGSVVNERLLEDGARLALDNSGKYATALIRPDGSRVDVTRERGEITKVVETSSDGRSVNWTRTPDGNFVSNGQPPEQRREIKLGVQGRYTYEDAKGFTHVITGAGAERTEPRITRNDDGTTAVEIQYPGADQSRTLTLDSKGNLIRFSEQDQDGRRTYFQDGSGRWHMKAGLKNIPVPGDFKLTKEGEFVSVDKNTYDIQRLDGTVIHEKVNPNETRLRLDNDGNITRLTRKDGSTVAVTWKNGEKSSVVETDKSGHRTTWSKGTDGTWTSDAKPPEKRKNIDITNEGLVIGTDLQGRKHVTLGDGAKITEGAGGSRFTFDEQGRITSITYPPGSQWGRIAFQYDQSGQINKWELHDSKGKLLETRTRQGSTDRWQVRDSSGKDMGTWTGDVRVSQQGSFMQRDVNDRKNGVWSHVTPDFKTYHERATGDGVLRTCLDKTEIELNTDGKITRYTSGKYSRSFEYENGELTKITDVTPAGTKTFNAKDHKNVGVDPRTGDYFYEHDGKVHIAKSNGSKLELNSDGLITSVTTDKGASRTFIYKQGSSELEAVIDRRKVGDSEREEKWVAQKNSDGTYRLTRSGADGKQVVRDSVEVGRDGSYKYKNTDGRDALSRIERAGDGSVPASVEEARERFMDVMREHFDEGRLKRLEQMTRGFEERMNDRAEARRLAGVTAPDKIDEWKEQSMAMTYHHLAEMVSSNRQGTFYDQKTRVKLAENFLFHAMDPTTMDQGPASAGDYNGHGTCWIQAGHIWGMTQHPDKMARLVSQVAVDGKFTTLNNGENDPAARTFTFSRRYLQLRQGSQEANWTIDNAYGKRTEDGRHWRMTDGHRSPVGRIFDFTLPVLAGRREGNVDGGLYEDTRARGYGTRRIMHMVTGDSPCDVKDGYHSRGHLINNNLRQTLLEKGSVLNYRPGHMMSLHVKKINGEWYKIQDNQHGESDDRILAKITDIERWARGDRNAEQQTNARVPRRRLSMDGKDEPVGPVTPTGTDVPTPWPGPRPGPQPCPYPDPGPHIGPCIIPRPRRIIRWRRR